MAKVTANRVLETSNTTGTGNYTLAGAVASYRTFASVCTDGDHFSYYVEAVDNNGAPTGDFEEGLGMWSTGGILTRLSVYDSSNAGSAVSWISGTKRIALSFLAVDALPTAYNSQIAAYQYGGL